MHLPSKPASVPEKYLPTSQIVAMSEPSGMVDCSPYLFDKNEIGEEDDIFKPTSEEKLFNECVSVMVHTDRFKSSAIIGQRESHVKPD